MSILGKIACAVSAMRSQEAIDEEYRSAEIDLSKSKYPSRGEMVAEKEEENLQPGKEKPAAKISVNSADARRVRVSDLWHSRRVASVVGVRDLKVKYKQSILGPAWLLIQPLGLLAGFLVVFQGIADVDTQGIPYILFALAGLVVWLFLQLSSMAGAFALIGNRLLITRLSAPRIAFSNGSVIGTLLSPVILATITLIGLVISGHVGPQLLWFPVMCLWVLTVAWGMALILSAVTARYRDVISVLPFLFQGAVFFSPVAYPASAAPENIQTFLNLNPATGLLEAWRWCLLGTDPQLTPLIISLVATVVLVLVAWKVFTYLEPRLADFI